MAAVKPPERERISLGAHLLPDAPDEKVWVQEGLIAAGDRCIVTGAPNTEGGGKTTFMLQVAVASALGLHPFKPQLARPAPPLGEPDYGTSKYLLTQDCTDFELIDGEPVLLAEHGALGVTLINYEKSDTDLRADLDMIARAIRVRRIDDDYLAVRLFDEGPWVALGDVAMQVGDFLRIWTPKDALVYPPERNEDPLAQVRSSAQRVRHLMMKEPGPLRNDLIIVSPLYRLLEDAGLDAESSHDAGFAQQFLDAMQDECGRLDRWKDNWDNPLPGEEPTKAALLIEAHANHSGEARPAGSASWKRWPELGYSLGITGDVNRGNLRSSVSRFRRDRGQGYDWPLDGIKMGSEDQLPWVIDDGKPALERIVGGRQAVKAIDQVLAQFKEDLALTTSDVISRLPMLSPGTVRNNITKLKEAGKIEAVEGGYVLCEEQS